MSFRKGTAAADLVQNTLHLCVNDGELAIFEQDERTVADRVGTLNVIFSDGEHIADQEHAQFPGSDIANMKNIIWDMAAVPDVNQPLIFVDPAAKGDHPEKARGLVFNGEIMRPVTSFVPLQIRIWEVNKETLGYNVKSSFVQKSSYEESPSKEGTFDPTICIPRIGQRKTFDPTICIPHIGQRNRAGGSTRSTIIRQIAGKYNVWNSTILDKRV